jgi:hypothetical protein
MRHERRFAMLGEALLHLKTEGEFESSIALIVSGTDADDGMVRLAEPIVRSLNDAATYARWRLAFGLDP